MYIFWLLHQTTTDTLIFSRLIRCISFDSYIKPQLGLIGAYFGVCCISFDSYIKPQPSLCNSIFVNVVYLLTPTSNHNSDWNLIVHILLYIFWLLHQTTTILPSKILWFSCISFDSYIKPQLTTYCIPMSAVVYLLTPTSNHNSKLETAANIKLYIFWLLHQTTTRLEQSEIVTSCISFDSYIKPQRDSVYNR